MMNYPIHLSGFEGQNIEVQPAGLLSGPRLLVNGVPAAGGSRRGQMLLRRNDGTEAIVTWKPQFMGMDVPRLVVDGLVVNVVEPLPWYEWVWSGLPVLLVFMGGVLGVIAGLVAFGINLRIFRSSLNTLVKFFLTAAVSLMGAAAYLIVATWIYPLLRH